MNEHIEIVKKWLADNDLGSLKDLRENAGAAADASYHAADVAVNAAQAAANASYYAHAHTAKYAEYAADKAAADWVYIYEELVDD